MNHIQSPATGDQAIERAIVSAGANIAPRVTPADIEANIASEHYFTAFDGVVGAAAKVKTSAPLAMVEYDEKVEPSLNLLTFCVLVLKNGFTVTGESACVSRENFDAEIGRKVARENAVNKLWPLLGYALKERLGAIGFSAKGRK